MNNDDRFAGMVVAYVTGELTGRAAEELERHVAGCPSCAALVEREARLEVCLHELGPHAARALADEVTSSAMAGAGRGPAGRG
jgi:anti-sigma factor RsiW